MYQKAIQDLPSHYVLPKEVLFAGSKGGGGGGGGGGGINPYVAMVERSA